MNFRSARFLYAAVLVCCGPLRADAPPAAVPYLSPGQVDSVALLAPPPAPGSAAAVQDLKDVIAIQRASHAEGTIERAIADSQASCGRIADVLHLSAGSNAGVDFATRAALEVAAATGPAKHFWHRPRPYVVSARVAHPGDVALPHALEPAASQYWNNSSYPSFHAAFGAACAILLAQMVPEERAALFARGRAFGQSRIILGAHFPTDVEAGRLIGTAAAAFLQQSPQFQADLRAARTALRQSLGLPAELPAPSP